MESKLINAINSMALLTQGTNLGEYHRAIADTARLVQVVPCREVLTAEQIDYIKKVLKPQQGQCYKNATDVAHELGCQYVEGQFFHLLPIDHAFNKVGDKYIDVTAEFVLNQDVTQTEYVSVGEYSFNECVAVLLRNEVYGGVWKTNWLTKNKGYKGKVTY